MNGKKSKWIRNAFKQAGKDWRNFRRAYRNTKKLMKKGIPYDRITK